jgi:signal transduction histidine kinase
LALAVAVLLRGRPTVPPSRFAALALNLVAWFVLDALVLAELMTEASGLALQGIVAGFLPSTLIGFYAAFTAEEDRFAGATVLTGRILTGLAVATGIILWATGRLFADTESHLSALVGLVRFGFGAVLLMLGLSVVLMVRRTRAVELRSERTRIVALTIVSGAVFSLALLSYAFDVGVAWLGNMTPALFMFFVYQVITLRRILDVYEFVGRVLVLGGFALVLSVIYALLVAWWRHDLGLFLFNTVIATIVILILLDPLRQFVEARLNELVFRERFEFTRQAEVIRKSLANVIDVGGMSDLLMSRLGASRQVTHASLWLRDEEGLAMKRLGFVGTAPPPTLDAIKARPLLTRLLQQKVMTIEGLEAEREALIAERERAAEVDESERRPTSEPAEAVRREAEAAGGPKGEPMTRPGVPRPLAEDVAHAQAKIEVVEAMIATMNDVHAQLMAALVGAPKATTVGTPLELETQSPELLGFIAVKNERLREAWSADETRAIVALATQATIIIENSMLFDRIRERDRLAAIGQMAAGLAHEIRNPLGAIKGSAQLLAEVDPAERGTFLQIIQEEVNRLDSVVSQFLTYARPLKGKRDMVDVNHVLERTLTLITADNHTSKVELVTAPNLPQIRSDPELIRQVALNLSRNAIEAMAPQGGGKLTIATAMTWRSGSERSGGTRASGVADPGSYIRIRFEDEGPGIPPEVMERLFIPFYTTKQTGTGLGLAICQRIVESLGGTIEVASRVGRGATFTVFLPVSEAPIRSTVA